jgi:hypothetical protein
MELVAGSNSRAGRTPNIDIAGGSLDEELDSILSTLSNMHTMDLGVQMETYMGLMARCTEIKVVCLEHEGRNRQLKVIRTQKVQPIMELIEFLWRGASRLVELRRMEVELSR